MRIIIIGGGPAGLITALRLSATGVAGSISIYEVRPEPVTIGGAVQIPPNGLRLLQRMGLYEKTIARGFHGSHLQLHSTQGETLLTIDRAASSRSKNEFGFLRILRTDLVDVLTEAVRERGLDIQFAKRIIRIEESETGITAHFSDESSASADLLLGCDGIHSAVRTLHVDPQAQSTYTGISTVYSIIPVSTLDQSNQAFKPALHATFTPDGLLALSPCTASADQIYWFFSRFVALPDSGSREGWAAAGKKENEDFKTNILNVLGSAEGKWIEGLRDIVRKTDAIKFYPVYSMPLASRWSTSRCLLLGDAAHAMPPHLGQGTSMALEDAFLLARLLEDPNRPLTNTFAIYERIRRKRTESIAKASIDRGTMREPANKWVHRAKELAIRIGGWVYETARLENLGIGMDRDVLIYDIMDEPI